MYTVIREKYRMFLSENMEQGRHVDIDICGTLFLRPDLNQTNYLFCHNRISPNVHEINFHSRADKIVFR